MQPSATWFVNPKRVHLACKSCRSKSKRSEVVIQHDLSAPHGRIDGEFVHLACTKNQPPAELCIEVANGDINTRLCVPKPQFDGIVRADVSGAPLGRDVAYLPSDFIIFVNYLLEVSQTPRLKIGCRIKA